MGQRAKEFIHSQGHTSMKIQFMQDTKLADLTCRLGEPYVYIHQGRCEHLLVFRNICMRQTTDKISLEDYPICTYLKKFKSVICRICEEKASRIVVAPKSTLNDSPCFICNTCFAKFALDEDGEKSFPFVSAPFFDKNTVKH
ncbi:unnamed protein product, partial [Mesorhabditis belari]|uniref:snRNA-activating protein complex subunit 3 n=1 Tax=Mesorhabditis belari TaxID=2138241 RepID=A0AAF3FNT3_9BILA